MAPDTKALDLEVNPLAGGLNGSAGGSEGVETESLVQSKLVKKQTSSKPGFLKELEVG